MEEKPVDLVLPDPLSSIEDFKKQQIYQQVLQSNAGFTTISQSIVSGVAKSTLEGVQNIDMDVIERLLAVTKTLQMDTIDILNHLETKT